MKHAGAVGGYQAKVLLTETAEGRYQVGGAPRPDDSWRPVVVQVSDTWLAAFNALQRPPEPSALAIMLKQAGVVG